MLSIISCNNLERMKDTLEIIDIRSIENYNNNHILNSRNIPINNLLLEPSKYLNKLSYYCLYCKKGKDSIKLGQILSNQGYKIYSLDGGYEEWILTH